MRSNYKAGGNFKRRQAHDYSAAREAYVSGASISEVSSLFGIPQGTLKGVIRREGWTTLRRTTQTTMGIPSEAQHATAANRAIALADRLLLILDSRIANDATIEQLKTAAEIGQRITDMVAKGIKGSRSALGLREGTASVETVEERRAMGITLITTGLTVPALTDFKTGAPLPDPNGHLRSLRSNEYGGVTIEHEQVQQVGL